MFAVRTPSVLAVDNVHFVCVREVRSDGSSLVSSVPVFDECSSGDSGSSRLVTFSEVCLDTTKKVIVVHLANILVALCRDKKGREEEKSGRVDW
ncbi:hypothetical protein SPBR_06296 [Sporothrix brasiliensis 5110]|uniref:Uncharacterized protein n=1 Tax=Sporothrix brasiliensis 5110 TaxID=1398154 RepID=A0A0C2FTA8_9PEZI|nr:uncharacterized protein SPBR_06296 [Sporothrix brasiliensis 5110]KIH94253.1 hypothetical protein SPBR_06296 [Sporothrix brasiliensis 5110]